MAKKKKSYKTTPTEALLFYSDTDVWHNAYLNKFHIPWSLYATGYRKAAELLVEHCHALSYGRSNPFYEKNTLVYPIVFLYRQYVELTLKMIIQEGNKVVTNPQPLPKTHSLATLWPVCRHVIQERRLPISTKDLSSIEDYIKQFSMFDPTSEAFRYPITTQEAPSLPPTLESISLRGLTDAMRKFAELLESVSTLLGADVDLELEFRKDLYSDW